MLKSSFRRTAVGFVSCGFVLLSLSTAGLAAPSPKRDPAKEAAEAPPPKGPSEGAQPSGKAISPPRDPSTEAAEAPPPKGPSEGAQPTQK